MILYELRLNDAKGGEFRPEHISLLRGGSRRKRARQYDLSLFQENPVIPKAVCEPRHRNAGIAQHLRVGTLPNLFAVSVKAHSHCG